MTGNVIGPEVEPVTIILINSTLSQGFAEESLHQQEVLQQSPVLVDTSVKHSHTWAQGTLQKRGGKTVKANDQGLRCEVVSPGNISSCTHKVSRAGPHNRELNKKDTNEHSKLDRENPQGFNAT